MTRAGTQLMVQGRPFRFSGPNIYWLGLDENEGAIGYPSPVRVDDAFATAQLMGATVVRAHTLGVSTGCPLCIEPSLGIFNEIALGHVDYAIKSAHEHGIRLVIPLTDEWRWYHGGKHNFTDWRGLKDETEFYSESIVIDDFKNYINHLLNRINTYTGTAYKDDPTILAWETGNELGGAHLSHGPPLTSWTETIANYIKSIAPHHLVVDGSYGVYPNALSLQNVDIYSNHYYPMTIGQLQSDANAVSAAGKVFMIGEFDWANHHPGGDSLSAFLSVIESTLSISGDFFWSLFGHNRTCSDYVYHDSDGETLHYPGDNPDMRNRAKLLQTHSYRMSGLPRINVTHAPCPLEWAGPTAYPGAARPYAPDGRYPLRYKTLIGTLQRLDNISDKEDG